MSALGRRDWLEDFTVGAKEKAGTIAFSEDEIIAFARAFDPQNFHVDPEAARMSPYGGLIASGWHTMSKLMQVVSGGAVAAGGAGFIASPGFEDLRWLRPVRPGDVLDVWIETLSVTPSASKPGQGLIIQHFTAVDAADRVVCSVMGKVFFKRRGTA